MSTRLQLKKSNTFTEQRERQDPSRRNILVYICIPYSRCLVVQRISRYLTNYAHAKPNNLQELLPLLNPILRIQKLTLAYSLKVSFRIGRRSTLVLWNDIN